MNFGTEKQLRRLVEVTATIGLIKMSAQNRDALKRYRDKLEALAFPEEISFTEKQIRQKQRVIRDFFGNCVKCGTECVCKKWNAAGHEVCDDL